MFSTENAKTIIAERKGCEVSELTLDTKIARDSLEKLDILVALEDAFDLRVDDKEMQNLETIEDLLTFLQLKEKDNGLR